MYKTYLFIGAIVGTCLGSAATLILQKLTGQISTTWPLVLAPLWVPAMAFALISFVIAFSVGSMVKSFGERK